MRNGCFRLRGKRFEGGGRDDSRAAQVAKPRRAGRRGAAAAELALVLPVFISLIVGMFEFSRAFMLKQAVTAAAQEACRVAILDGSTSTSVRSKALASLSPAGIGSSSVTVTTTPTAPSSGGYDTPVSVTVSVPYSAVSSTAAWFLPANANLTATVTMRRETVK
ncbi:MAG: TadE family protein [Planctomycetota bacterium]